VLCSFVPSPVPLGRARALLFCTGIMVASARALSTWRLMSIHRYGCFSLSAIRLHRDYPNGCRAVRIGLLNPGSIASRLFLYCTFCIFPFLNFHYLIKKSIYSSFPTESQTAMLRNTARRSVTCQSRHGATGSTKGVAIIKSMVVLVIECLHSHQFIQHTFHPS
jgi:hypothetical protein